MVHLQRLPFMVLSALGVSAAAFCAFLPVDVVVTPPGLVLEATGTALNGGSALAV